MLFKLIELLWWKCELHNDEVDAVYGSADQGTFSQIGFAISVTINEAVKSSPGWKKFQTFQGIVYKFD